MYIKCLSPWKPGMHQSQSYNKTVLFITAEDVKSLLRSHWYDAGFPQYSFTLAAWDIPSCHPVQETAVDFLEEPFHKVASPASDIPRLDSHTPGACTAAEACRRDKLQGNRSPCCNTDRHTVQRAGSQTETFVRGTLPHPQTGWDHWTPFPRNTWPCSPLWLSHSLHR